MLHPVTLGQYTVFRKIRTSCSIHQYKKICKNIILPRTAKGNNGCKKNLLKEHCINEHQKTEKSYNNKQAKPYNKSTYIVMQLDPESNLSIMPLLQADKANTYQQ
jgi:hypothetical protein